LLKPVPEIDIWAEQNIIGIPVFNCLEISRTVCAYRPIAKANRRFQIPVAVEEFKSPAKPGMKVQLETTLDLSIIFITELQ
jgi:hypothetical protein